MISKTTEYALRAMIELARQPPEEYCLAKDLAGGQDIPFHFLSKILQRLARAGLVRSVRGIGGGFALARSAESISLKEIVQTVQDMDAKTCGCILGNQVCNEDSPCPLHYEWVRIREQFSAMLVHTALAEAARSVTAVTLTRAD